MKLGRYQCSCGNTIVRPDTLVRQGKIKSCGCLLNYHGLTGTPEFNALRAAIQRCDYKHHPKYPYHGGRGITVCPAWRDDPKLFVAHIGLKPTLKHSLDRIDRSEEHTSELQSH